MATNQLVFFVPLQATQIKVYLHHTCNYFNREFLQISGLYLNDIRNMFYDEDPAFIKRVLHGLNLLLIQIFLVSFAWSDAKSFREISVKFFMHG